MTLPVRTAFDEAEYSRPFARTARSRPDHARGRLITLNPYNALHYKKSRTCSYSLCSSGIQPSSKVQSARSRQDDVSQPVADRYSCAQSARSQKKSLRNHNTLSTKKGIRTPCSSNRVRLFESGKSPEEPNIAFQPTPLRVERDRRYFICYHVL